MIIFTIALLLGGVTPNSSNQSAVQDKGKLGTWYWRSPGVNAPADEDEETPILEKKGDDYKAPQRTFSRALAPISFGRFRSVQVNVNSSSQNIIGDAGNEPSLAVDPNNRNHIVAGWRQFDNVTSNFRQAGNAYSLDGGTSWHNQDVLTRGTFRSDPVLAADSLGNFFYNSLQQTFFADVFGSSNSGLNWNFKAQATGGDKQWMTCDQTSGPGRGFLYESWSTAGNNYGGRQFSRSIDGGTSWLDPINIPGSPVWGTLDVASNGALYLCGLGNSTFEFCRSSDAQVAQQVPTFDRVTQVNLGGAIVYGANMNPAGLLGQTWIATDKSSGPNSGNIYMLCSVGVDTPNPCQVNFARSRDGGLTWTAPKTINTDPLNQGVTHWFGTMSVAPSGRIDVCWYDNRANPASNNSALFESSSYDGGATWTANLQLSPYFNPNIGYPNQNKMGDYMGMVSDSRGANIIYSATHNGEEDIWFLRLPTLAAQPASAIAIKTFQGVHNNGGLSDIRNPEGSTYGTNSVVVPKLGSVAATETDFHLPIPDIGELAIKLRATSSMSTTAMVWLWNWNTQAYEFQKSVAWKGGAAVETTVSIEKAIAPYIDSHQNVRCLVRYIDPSRLGSRTMSVQFDLIQLLFG